jgi:hypothetical protein
MLRSVEFSLLTLRERNQRFASIGGRMAQASREKAQRTTARAMCAAYFGQAPSLTIVPTATSIAATGERFSKPNAIKVTCTRIGPGRLDSDGPSDAMKNVRDGVADWLGVNDGDGSVHWSATQERAPNGTPWRVRITIEDLTFGSDRPPVVLASSPIPSRKKKNRKTAGAERGAGRSKGEQLRGTSPGVKAATVQLTIGDDEQSPRVLVPCSRASCFAALGLPCIEDGGAMIHGVHVERAQAAGVVAARLRGISRALGGLGTVQDGPGVATATACPNSPPKGPRRIVKSRKPAASRTTCEIAQFRNLGQAPLPLVRVLLALPWLRPLCEACEGTGRDLFDSGLDDAPYEALCDLCLGSGRGKAQAVPEPRLDGLRPPAVHRVAVPPQYASAWGKVIEMYPRRATVAGCDVVIYETKEARR